MRTVTVTVEIIDTNSGERLRNSRKYTEFNLKASVRPDFIATETQDVVNTLLDVINEE